MKVPERISDSSWRTSVSDSCIVRMAADRWTRHELDYLESFQLSQSGCFKDLNDHKTHHLNRAQAAPTRITNTLRIQRRQCQTCRIRASFVSIAFLALSFHLKGSTWNTFRTIAWQVQIFHLTFLLLLLFLLLRIILLTVSERRLWKELR